MYSSLIEYNISEEYASTWWTSTALEAISFFVMLACIVSLMARKTIYLSIQNDPPPLPQSLRDRLQADENENENENENDSDIEPISAIPKDLRIYWSSFGKRQRQGKQYWSAAFLSILLTSFIGALTSYLCYLECIGSTQIEDRLLLRLLNLHKAANLFARSLGFVMLICAITTSFWEYIPITTGRLVALLFAGAVLVFQHVSTGHSGFMDMLDFAAMSVLLFTSLVKVDTLAGKYLTFGVINLILTTQDEYFEQYILPESPLNGRQIAHVCLIFAMIGFYFTASETDDQTKRAQLQKREHEIKSGPKLD